MTYQPLPIEFDANDHPYPDLQPPSKPVIEIGEAHAGAGKSRSIFDQAAKTIDTENTIIALPSDNLSFQYVEYFREIGIEPTVISRKINKDYASSQHLKDAVKRGDKLIQVYFDVLHGTAADLSGYNIIEDEPAEPLEIIQFRKAQYMRDNFEKLIAVKTTKSADHYELQLTITAIDIAKNGWNYAGIKENPDLVKLCKAVESRHFHVYVLADSFNRYSEGELQDIQFWIVRLPTIYANAKSVTMAGANAFDLLLPKMWADHAEFTECQWMKTDYADLKHLKDRARLLYISKKPFTGNCFDQFGRQYVADMLADKIEQVFPDRQHIFGMNKQKSGAPFKWKYEGTTGERVDLLAHGLNAYKHINMCVYLAAQYRDPATYKFLKDMFGISGDEVTRAFTYDRMYQFAMRISSRDFNSEEPFVMIVPDQGCAEFLQSLFGCGEPEMLDIGIPELHEEEQIFMTLEQRQAKNTAYQASKREKKKSMENAHSSTVQYDGFKYIQWENKYAQSLSTADTTWAGLGDYLTEQHLNYNPAKKSDALCFREGDLTDVSNHKLVSNIKSTKLVILDIDVVKRDPKDLSDFLYESGMSHYIFNSHSSTPLEPSIRVIIGLGEAVNAANYLHIINLVRADIDAKFGAGTYEVDDSKITINSKFHNPSVSPYKSPILFKRTIKQEGFTFEPKLLDVQWFLSRNPVTFKKEKKVSVSSNTASARTGDKKQAIQDVLDEHAVPAGSGKGSISFFNASVEMKKLGLTKDDVVQIMTANRHRFGDGQDRDAVYTVGRVFEVRK